MGATGYAIIGGIVTALLTAAGMVWVARINAHTAKVNAHTAPYEALANRVSTLELADETKGQQIDELQRQLRIVTADRDGVVHHLKEMWKWAISGSRPPPPAIPDHLHNVLPPSEYVWPNTPADPRRGPGQE